MLMVQFYNNYQMILYDIVEMGQTDFVITLWFNAKAILLCDNKVVPM